MQLLSILQLRQRYTLALCGISGRNRDSIAALRHVNGPLVFAEIESGYGSDSPNRESSLQWKIISIQPTAQHQPSVDPRCRRQPVVAAEIQQAAAVAHMWRRRRSCDWRRQSEVGDVADSVFILGLNQPSCRRIVLIVSGVDIRAQHADVKTTRI